MTRSPVRWLGGKHHLKHTLRSLYRHSGCDRVVDPFVGSASVLLSLAPANFIAGDANGELINFLEVCKAQWYDIYEMVSNMEDTSSEFYSMRQSQAKDSVDSAVRFLYLNRTAYGGIYRVNRDGVFNVPYGGGGRLHVKDLQIRLECLYKVLQNGELHAQDYQQTLADAALGDFVVADPPYSTSSDVPFGRYTRDGFSASDHHELACLLNSMTADGRKVVLTMPRHPVLISPFSGWWMYRPHAGDSVRSGEVVLANFSAGVFDGFSRRSNVNVVPVRIPSRYSSLIRLLDDSRSLTRSVSCDWSIARSFTYDPSGQ